MKLLTLEQWADAVYGDNRPHIVTLRRWASEGKIYPAPEKHGRSYFVQPDARYIDPTKPIVTTPTPRMMKAANVPLVERIRRGKAA